MATKNPYLEIFQSIHRGGGRGGMDVYTRRQELVKQYAWAVPNDKVLRMLKEFSKSYVEIGAGTGYWAHLLLSMDVRVDAYDDNSWKMSDVDKLWSPVHPGGPEKAGKHPKSALLLIWPPYKSSMGADAVRAYLKAGGERVAYVGESWGGCNGDEEMFDLLKKKFDGAGMCIDMPNWDGLHDYAQFYVRK